VAMPLGKPGLLCSQCLWAGAAKSATVPDEDDSLAELSELLPDYEGAAETARPACGGESVV
jgi:hypothetical protein